MTRLIEIKWGTVEEMGFSKHLINAASYIYVQYTMYYVYSIIQTGNLGVNTKALIAIHSHSAIFIPTTQAQQKIGRMT
jgi:hypothetical protein